MKLPKMLVMMGAVALVPISLPAQQTDPVTRLQSVLPTDVATKVIPIVQEAMSQDLPANAVANVALQGVAMGRSGDEVRAAAEAMVSDLRAAHDALSVGGRPPTPEETQAGALAMQQGVDGATVSALARSAPANRSLAVPLAVIGALVDRGLPAEDALQAVQGCLQNRSSDQQIADLPAGAGQMLAQGMKPSDVGLALASTRAGFTVPAGGVSVPAGGAPSGVTANGGVAGKRPTNVGRGSHGRSGGGI